MMKSSTIIIILTKYSIWIGLFIRLLLAWLLPYLLDNNQLLPGVAYTDIDFYVFSDAAVYIQNGSSPYQRTTYRYTPFLAYILSLLSHREYGRYIFCIADTICGYIIVLYRQQQRTVLIVNNNKTDHNNNNNNNTEWTNLVDTLWWIYNPFAINICTRGSAESFVVLLPVLCTLWLCTITKSLIVQQHSYTNTTTITTPSTTTDRTRSSSSSSSSSSRTIQLQMYTYTILAGICHGVAIHAKLYPIIYTLSFMTQFVSQANKSNMDLLTISSPSPSSKSSLFRTIYTIGIVWIRRLVLCPLPLVFGIVTVASFATVTYYAVTWYGNDYIQEGLLYHLSRLDHRHNYSIHWYWIYLLRDRLETVTSTTAVTTNATDWIQQLHPEMLSKLIGRVLLVPQLFLLLYSSIGIAPNSLSLALFVQTYLFVIQNKVITAQYFTWYLCLLPLCSNQFDYTKKRVQYSFLLLGLSILTWLGSAYCLEMQGMAVHSIVWIASILYYIANVNVFGALLSSTKGTTTTTTSLDQNQKNNINIGHKIKMT